MDNIDDIENYEELFSNIEQENNEDDKKEELFGFDEVLKQRQIKKDALRKRLYKYYLNDEEIDNLFKIIERTEQKMEKIKYSLDYSNLKDGQVTDMTNKLLKVQDEMKVEFDKQLNKVLKKKYENAKKILEKQKKKDND